MIRFLFFLNFILIPTFWVASQNVDQKALLRRQKSVVLFQASENQIFGFDSYKYKAWKNYYDTIAQNHPKTYRIPSKSVGYLAEDECVAYLKNCKMLDKDSIYFKLELKNVRIKSKRLDDTLRLLLLPKMSADYNIEARYKGELLGLLHVKVFKENKRNILIVPVGKQQFNKDSLILAMNKTFKQANIQLNFEIKPAFYTDTFQLNSIFDNPSPLRDRYTKQMHLLRDLYFEKNPKTPKNAIYVFVISGFVDQKIKAYMPPNKAMAFIKSGSWKMMNKHLSKELAIGVGMLKESFENDGPKKGSTQNLLDEGNGIHLTHFQWELLRHQSNSFSYYDNDEDVITNNGLVAYYFWKTDSLGNIQLQEANLLKSIVRPFKRNYTSYHLNIDDIFYKTIFKLGNYMICFWHLVAFVVIFLYAYLLRRRFHKFLLVKLRRPRRLKFFSRIFLFLTACGLYVWIFYLINLGYSQFEIDSGNIKEYQNFSFDKVVQMTQSSRDKRSKTAPQMLSQVMIQEDSTWVMKKLSRVLYFKVIEDEKQNRTCKFLRHSNTLTLPKHDYRALAKSHYLVFNFYDKKGKFTSQKLYNHLGVDLSEQLFVKDIPKRILLMVNGYRPTSVGHTFEDYFNNIQNKGLEHQASNNLIYDFDRYNYWKPWRQIDTKFQKRINPMAMYYADGHFSVTTSNHRSMVNFTTVSAMYPKRCKNKRKHICKYTTISGTGLFGSKTVKTETLHRTKPNKKGFKLRYDNGKIAGKNLLQILNELPNISKNDTIYIVAHSMGYAYALGIISEMRHHIHFGDFYIIAPENASEGKINMNEWKEIWQYGSNFNPGEMDAPCLLDGVAPQAKVRGLADRRRVYIPENQYAIKGYFDSHFIGYYTWIFDIPKGKNGYIVQR